MSTLTKVEAWSAQRDYLTQELVDELVELCPTAVTSRERKYYPKSVIERVRALNMVSGWGPDLISSSVHSAGGPRISRHTITSWIYSAPNQTS